MKKIVLINGSGGCGKSTFVKFCSFLNSNVIELSTVDYVKEVATYCGWDGTKKEKDRIFLHDLKVALEKWNNSPIIKTIESIEDNWDKEIFFVNVRENYNIEALKNAVKNNLRCYTLLITNSNKPKIISNEADANVDDYNYDYIIDNSGTISQLFDKANDFLQEIEKE